MSYLRAGLLKRALPVQAMVAVDAALQLSAPLGALSPSVFIRNSVSGAAVADAARERFVSPRSGAPLRRDGDVMVCDADGTRWRVNGNFYDFKEPV